MKLLFVNDPVYARLTGSSSLFNGAERQQWLLARALARRGWSVTFGIREGMKTGERNTIDGIDFLGIGKSTILVAWHRMLSSERPDWWYWRCASHWWGAAVELAKQAKVRTVFAAAFDSDVNPRRALTHRPNWWPLYAWGLGRADRILVQHQGQLRGSPRVCEPKRMWFIALRVRFLTSNPTRSDKPTWHGWGCYGTRNDQTYSLKSPAELPKSGLLFVAAPLPTGPQRAMANGCRWSC